MRQTTLRPILAAAVLVAAAVPALASGSSDRHAAPTLHTLMKTVAFTSVDADHNGKPSVGDYTVAQVIHVDPTTRKRIGTGVAICTQVNAAGTLFDCEGSDVLPGGELREGGRLVPAATWHLSILGGSGKFDGASGSGRRRLARQEPDEVARRLFDPDQLRHSQTITSPPSATIMARDEAHVRRRGGRRKGATLPAGTLAQPLRNASSLTIGRLASLIGLGSGGTGIADGGVLRIHRASITGVQVRDAEANVVEPDLKRHDVDLLPVPSLRDQTNRLGSRRMPRAPDRLRQPPSGALITSAREEGWRRRDLVSPHQPTLCGPRAGRLPTVPGGR